jgi:hypothetical protein
MGEFGLRDLEQGLHSWFEDWISGVNLWERYSMNSGSDVRSGSLVRR